VNFRFQCTETFWKKFYALSPGQKAAVRTTWAIFKKNPFDPRLGTHRINSLSARYGKTIRSVVVESDLRVVFYLEDRTVWTVDLGTHAIYR